jgi:nucleoside phosphorylase
MSSPPEASLLIFVAVSAEQAALKKACKARGLSFNRREHKQLGEYFDLGNIGSERVLAIRTEMGPFGRDGAASKARLFQIGTGAQAILSLGIAFGVSPETQSIGDVLVSTSIFPYDARDIVSSHKSTCIHGIAERLPRSLRGVERTFAGYRIVYDKTRRQPVREELLDVLRRSESKQQEYRVHFGTILSGGARIHSRCFRRELVDLVPEHEHEVVGGEMESVGLLVTSTADTPTTVVCKGISDFADHNRDTVIKRGRPLAAGNAASFVIDALLNDSTRTATT